MYTSILMLIFKLMTVNHLHDVSAHGDLSCVSECVCVHLCELLVERENILACGKHYGKIELNSREMRTKMSSAQTMQKHTCSTWLISS